MKKNLTIETSFSIAKILSQLEVLRNGVISAQYAMHQRKRGHTKAELVHKFICAVINFVTADELKCFYVQLAVPTCNKYGVHDNLVLQRSGVIKKFARDMVSLERCVVAHMMDFDDILGIKNYRRFNCQQRDVLKETKGKTLPFLGEKGSFSETLSLVKNYYTNHEDLVTIVITDNDGDDDEDTPGVPYPSPPVTWHHSSHDS